MSRMDSLEWRVLSPHLHLTIVTCQFGIRAMPPRRGNACDIELVELRRQVEKLQDQLAHGEDREGIMSAHIT